MAGERRMTARKTPRTFAPEQVRLTREEQRSVTRGEFWIPEDERVIYQLALRTLNEQAVPYVVSGLYAMHAYTGVYRKTHDLDLFLEPGWIVAAARALKANGFHVRLEEAHWLAKARRDDATVDLIFGMGNGLGLIDEEWYRHARAGILAATQVRIAPAEELMWHRLYVSERHRHDMADVLHLIVCRGDELDWERLLRRLHQHHLLLIAHIHLFDFVYPGHRSRVPDWVRDHLGGLVAAGPAEPGDPTVCQGTLISRFSFTIDVKEWGLRDPREEAIRVTSAQPIVHEILESDVWND
jgi:hypothetical protein